MTTYSKNIAVIKGVKSGFSPDGGRLTGIIKAENYGNRLKVEVTLINFAPLAGGRYVTSLSDGVKEIIFEGNDFDGISELRTECGFGAAVCFAVNGEVNTIATAVCGDHAASVQRAEQAVLLAEDGGGTYNDDAVAEENYYEREDGKGNEGGGAVREDKAQEEILCGGQNEDAGGIGKEPQEEVKDDSFDDSAGSIEENGFTQEPQAKQIPLAEDIGFYEKVKDEIARIFDEYPECEELQNTVEHSRWAKVTYGNGKYYVFGVIYADNKPAYICYGVPSSNPDKPPQSLKGAAGYIPANGGGYWVMYQDARTGVSIKIDNI